MTLLLGDATATYTHAIDYDVQATEFNTYQVAWQFPALETGIVTTLRFRTNGTPNTGLSGLRLAGYADSGDWPGALIDHGVALGEPGTDSWVEVTGLSIPVVAGELYWLAALPLGEAGASVHFNTALAHHASGGTPMGDSPSTAGGTAATLLDPWPPYNGDVDDRFAEGPVGFQGLGDGASEPPRSSDLIWHVTGLWYPGETRVAYYGQIIDPSADNYADTLNDQSTGEVTFNAYAQDPYLVRNVIGKAYARFLKIYDCGRLAFWGPYKLGKVNFETGVCTLNCVDPSLRLSRHVLRRGDLLGTLNEANHDKGSVSVDDVGLRQLRDAGKNSAEQLAEGQPDLGIGDGANDFTVSPFNRMGVKRLDQVYNAMQQLSQSLGPDFSLRYVEDVVGSYALLDTFEHQGQDLSATIQFHFGTGLQNLDNLELDEGAKYTTHIHVLPRDHPETYRFTQANPAAALITGAYVDADTTDFDSQGIDPDKVEDVLRAYGDDYLKAYGRPLIQVTLTLPVDGPGVPRYGIDFNKGDTVGVAGRLKLGDITLCDLPPAPYRITSVQRVRDGEGLRSVVTVVGDMVAAADDAVASAGAGDEN